MYASKSTGGFYDATIHITMPDDVVEISAERHAELLAGQSTGKVITWGFDGYPTLTDAPVVWLTGTELAAKVDATIATVYLNWSRFQAEYEFREKAAQAYKTAGYEADCSIWITAFAEAAKLSLMEACDLILAQSVELRAAQESLGALRMRKYEILPLSEQAALDKYNEIAGQIQQTVALVV